MESRCSPTPTPTDQYAASALANLHLAPSMPPSPVLPNLSLLHQPTNKPKPRKLLSFCLGLLGEHLEDLISDFLDISALLPPHIKLIVLAIARRKRLLNDEVLIALAEPSWELLDLSGSDVTDHALTTIAKICTNLQAIDISRCDNATADGVSEIIYQCHSLRIFRCGK